MLFCCSISYIINNFALTLGKIVTTPNVLSPLCSVQPFMVTWATDHWCRANIRGLVARIHLYSHKTIHLSLNMWCYNHFSPLWTAQCVFTGFPDCKRLLYVTRLAVQLGASPFFKSNFYLIKLDHMQNNIQVLLIRVM